MPRDIPEECIDAALAADAEWMRTSRRVMFTSPARDQVRVMLEAAGPLIAAAERERAEAAEARLAEVRAAAEEWAALAPADDWGDLGREETADCGRAILAVIGGQGQDRSEEKGPDRA
jgi:hypothetical protein